MGWKTWPKWIKGAIYGYIISIIFVIVHNIFRFSSGDLPYFGRFVVETLLSPLAALEWAVFLIPGSIVSAIIIGKVRQGNAMSIDWFRWGVYSMVISVFFSIGALFMFLGGERLLFSLGPLRYATYLVYVLAIPAFLFSPGLIFAMIGLGMRGVPASVSETLIIWATSCVISLAWAFLLGSLLGRFFHRKNM